MFRQTTNWRLGPVRGVKSSQRTTAGTALPIGRAVLMLMALSSVRSEDFTHPTKDHEGLRKTVVADRVYASSSFTTRQGSTPVRR